MIQKLSAKFHYFVLNEAGREVTKQRSLHSLSINTSDDNINKLAEIYENLTGETYSIVEKVVTHVVMK
ncbi:hypothetical protein BN1048_00648 [Jeotgalicoccus saudimassiliensis]|uniref:DUF1659 domain-containing protein n=1 Tax=Jeotgalicoccus saudimassiliensis TaxID=1461582 RepID=A0A078M0J0_9STAP|nr:hypothetical protein [Jeotgalicoccus saudimassiliensis]CDZ99774.1 hypothetical protein BN1048_00648 [Jeotgalicoccus saudimassiliensis]